MCTLDLTWLDVTWLRGLHIENYDSSLENMDKITFSFLITTESLWQIQNFILSVVHQSCNSGPPGTIKIKISWLTLRVIFIHSLVFSLEGRAWQEPEPSHVTGKALAHCILGKFLGVVCHCFPPPLDVPTLAARCLCLQRHERSSSKRWNCGRERCPVVILPKFQLPLKFRDLLHAENLRLGTNGFTSPPKEGVLRIFFSP